MAQRSVQTNSAAAVHDTHTGESRPTPQSEPALGERRQQVGGNAYAMPLRIGANAIGANANGANANGANANGANANGVLKRRRSIYNELSACCSAASSTAALPDFDAAARCRISPAIAFTRVPSFALFASSSSAARSH